MKRNRHYQKSGRRDKQDKKRVIRVDKNRGSTQRHQNGRKRKNGICSKSSRKRIKYVFAQPEKRGVEWFRKPMDHLDNNKSFRSLMERLARDKIGEGMSEERVELVLQEYTRGVVTAMTNWVALKSTINKVALLNSSTTHEELARSVTPSMEMFKECPIVKFESVYYETTKDTMDGNLQMEDIKTTTKDGRRLTFEEYYDVVNRKSGKHEEQKPQPKQLSLEKRMKQRAANRKTAFGERHRRTTPTIQDIWAKYTQVFSRMAIYYLQYIIEPEMRLYLESGIDSRRRAGQHTSWYSYEELLLNRCMSLCECEI
ncbi:hypothetical protein OAV88_04030 [bacterium]|nr:hypothetical protein [bacterium]